MALIGLDMQLAPEDVPHGLVCDRALLFLAVARDKGRGYLPDCQLGPLPLQVSDHLEHLRFDVHPTIGDDLPLAFACYLPKLGADGWIADDAQERDENLIEPRFEDRVHEGVDRMFRSIA